MGVLWGQEHPQGCCRSHRDERCCGCGLFPPHFPGAEGVWAYDDGGKTSYGWDDFGTIM